MASRGLAPGQRGAYLRSMRLWVYSQGPAGEMAAGPLDSEGAISFAEDEAVRGVLLYLEEEGGAKLSLDQAKAKYSTRNA